jgi:WD40 repeat protein
MNDLSQSPVYTLENIHYGPIKCMAFESAQKYLFTGSQDGTIKMWHKGDFKRTKNILPIYTLADPYGPKKAICAMKIIAYNHHLFAAGEDGSIKVYNIKRLMNGFINRDIVYNKYFKNFSR